MPEKTLDEKVKGKGFKSGLPFKVDFKRLIQKTMASRSYDRLQYQKDLLKLALENNPVSVEVRNSRKEFSVSFDGEGINEEEAIQLLKEVYFNKSGAGIGKFSHFGKALLSALSINHQELNVLTHSDGEYLAMKIDREYQPVFRTPRSKKKVNRISVRKREKQLFDGIRDHLRYVLAKSTRLQTQREYSSLMEICRFSEIPVTINRKKASHGLHDPSAIFECKYKFGNSTILLSLPDQISERTGRAVDCISGNILIKSKTIPLSVLYKPDIAISNPDFNTDLSGRLMEDHVYEKAMEDARKAEERFYPDMLANLKDIEAREHQDKIMKVASCFLKDKIRSQDMDWYGSGEKESDDFRNLKSIRMFLDIRGNTYSISDIEEIIQNQDESHLFPYISGRDNINSKDPLVKNMEGVVMQFTSDIEKDIFRDLFICGFMKSPILNYRDVDWEDLDERVRERNSMIIIDKAAKRRKKLVKRRKRKDALAKAGRSAAKPTLITAGSTAAVYTAYTVGAGTLANTLAHPEIIYPAVQYGGVGAVAAGGIYAAWHLGKLSRKGIKWAYPHARRTVSSGVRAIGSGADRAMGKIEPVFVKARKSYREKRQACSDTVSKAAGIPGDKISKGTGSCKRAGSACIDRLVYFIVEKVDPVFGKAKGLFKKTSKSCGGKVQQAAGFCGGKAASQKEKLSGIIKNQFEKRRVKETALQDEQAKQLQKVVDAEKGFLTELILCLNKDMEGYSSIVKMYGVHDIKLENSPASRLFRADHVVVINGVEYKRLILWINTGSRKFMESSAEYRNFPPSIINVIIGTEKAFQGYDLERRLYEDSLRAHGIGLAYRHSLDMVLSSYCLEEDTFRESFGRLADPEKKHIIKRVLRHRSGSSRQNALDEWLLRDHEAMIQEVSEGGASGSAVKRIMSLYERERFGEAVYEFGLLTNEEIYDFFNSETGIRFVNESKEKNNPLYAHMKRAYPPTIIAGQEIDWIISEGSYNLRHHLKKKGIREVKGWFAREHAKGKDSTSLMARIIEHFDFEDPDFAKSLRSVVLECYKDKGRGMDKDYSGSNPGPGL